MSAIEKSHQIPDRKFAGKSLRRVPITCQPLTGFFTYTANCFPIQPAGNADYLLPRHGVLTAKLPDGDAAPKTPAAKVAFGQTFRGNVVIDDQLRQVIAACASL